MKLKPLCEQLFWGLNLLQQPFTKSGKGKMFGHVGDSPHLSRLWENFDWIGFFCGMFELPSYLHDCCCVCLCAFLLCEVIFLALMLHRLLS